MEYELNAENRRTQHVQSSLTAYDAPEGGGSKVKDLPIVKQILRYAQDDKKGFTHRKITLVQQTHAK